MELGFERVIILADESANWKIAGLRQLERLVLALDELAKLISSQRKIDIFVFWRPDVPIEQQFQVRNPRLTRVQFVQVMRVGAPERLLNTRMLVRRRGLEQFLADAVLLETDPEIGDEAAVWSKLWATAEARALIKTESAIENSRYLASDRDTSDAENWLLLGSAKSRDGIVSRYLNRPISRAVSRLLLKGSTTPSAWSWFILIFPLAGFLFLSRGHYFGFLVGALMFHIHSILDGCDGEIARAKYLDSEKGPGVDALGDLISLLLFSIGLGFGLYRGVFWLPPWFFLLEGLLTFLFIALRLGPHTADLLQRGAVAVASSDHDESLRTSGGRLVGDRATSLAFELTKRDVVFFVFLILAALGAAQWILHMLFVYGVATFVLRQSGKRVTA